MFGQKSDDNQTNTTGNRMKQLWCGLTGHDTLKHFERDRLGPVPVVGSKVRQCLHVVE
jgi:hypothetical protein